LTSAHWQVAAGNSLGGQDEHTLENLPRTQRSSRHSTSNLERFWPLDEYLD
jgi:hypothetical protein